MNHSSHVFYFTTHRKGATAMATPATHKAITAQVNSGLPLR
ncbi:MULTISPECIES: hypothetical protein [unclassified Halomonas]|nr:MULTISPECIES: hypothetical protein [unclassified Halomonas]